MIRVVHFILALFACLILSTGCGRRTPTIADHVTIFIPGVAGDGGWYDGAVRALSRGGQEPVEILRWGAPAPLFMANFSSESIHNAAEAKLAARLNALAGKRIQLVGHSAGCGVVLGALPRSNVHVLNVVLLAPSVSPTYDLRPAVAHVEGRLTVFYSNLDVTFLKWRTGHFGTYDRIKTPAAGHLGFDLSTVPPIVSQKIIQIPYDPSWKSLGHDGGHDGCVSERFVGEIVWPRLSP